MEPVPVWFYLNGSTSPEPGPETLPAAPHAPQPGEIWTRGEKGPRNAVMGIFVGYSAIDFDSESARKNSGLSSVENLDALKPQYAKAKELTRRQVSIGDNVARAGPECVPMIDIPDDRLYRVVAKCTTDVNSVRSPTGYYVLAAPDDNGVCEGYRPKGVTRETTFWLPYFRNDDRLTSCNERSEYQKERLESIRRELLGLPPKVSEPPPAQTSTSQNMTPEDQESEEVAASPNEGGSGTIFNSIERSPTMGLKRERLSDAPGIEPAAVQIPATKRQRQHENIEPSSLHLGSHVVNRPSLLNVVTTDSQPTQALYRQVKPHLQAMELANTNALNLFDQHKRIMAKLGTEVEKSQKEYEKIVALFHGMGHNSR